MRTLLATLIMVASLTAGCFGDDGGNGEVPSPEPPSSSGGSPLTPARPEEQEPIKEYRLMTQFEFADCDGLRFTYSLSRAAAASLIHDNYTPRPSEQSQTVPADEAQQASLQADLYQCAGFTAGRYAFENVWFGIIYIPVEPPSDARTADQHAYIIQMVGAEDVMTAIWKVVKYPTHEGNTTTQDFQAAQRASAGEYQWDVASTLPDQGATDGSFTWYYELPGGDRVTWTGTQAIPAGNGGAGSLAYPANAPFASLAPIPGEPLSGQGSIHADALFSEMDLVHEVAEFRE